MITYGATIYYQELKAEDEHIENNSTAVIERLAALVGDPL